MVSYFFERLGWAVAFTVVIAFFLPWLKTEGTNRATAERSETKKQEFVQDATRSWLATYFILNDQEIEAALSNPLSGENGLSLLLLTRNQSSGEEEKAKKLVSYLGGVDVREASLLIYAIPAFSLIAACFLTVSTGGRLVFLIPLAMCLGLYFLMRSRLSDTSFTRLALDVPIGIGLWLSLYGLLALTGLLILRIAWGMTRK